MTGSYEVVFILAKGVSLSGITHRLAVGTEDVPSVDMPKVESRSEDV